MGQQLDVDLLVSLSDICSITGKRTQTVSNWTLRPPSIHHANNPDWAFPEPVRRFGRTSVWYWPDVEKWLKLTGRVPQGWQPRSPLTGA